MNITYPLDLKRAIEHYENKLNEIKENGEEDSRLHTAVGKDFIGISLKVIPELLLILGDKERTITIYETSHPEQQTLACLALKQYIKDLDSDMKTLEDKLSFKSEHFQKIKREIDTAKLLQLECNCDSQR